MMDFNRGDIIISNPYPKKRDKLKENFDILINQIRTLSKVRIKEKIANLTSQEYDLVVKALCKNFKSLS